MFLSKMKLVGALGLLVAGLAVAVVAAGQGGGDRRQEEPAPAAVKAKLQPRSLPPEALAAHLGVVHASFELTFDKPQAEVTLAVHVYENGKRTAEVTAVRSRAGGKKCACSVLFSRGKEEGKLHLTVVTPDGTLNEVIDDPFGGPGLSYPSPRMDAEGRIPLALKAAKRRRGPGDVSAVTIANAAKALVVQVRKK